MKRFVILEIVTPKTKKEVTKMEVVTISAPRRPVLPEIPQMVVKYLEAEREGRLNQEGKYFRIRINREEKAVEGHGVAYYNELVIETRKLEGWIPVYSTGMLKYRGAFASDIDNWDLRLNDPHIIEESEISMKFAVRTGAGRVKVYDVKLTKGSAVQRLLIDFDLKGYQCIERQASLGYDVLVNYEAFKSYVGKDERRQRERWFVDFEPERVVLFNTRGEPIKEDSEAEIAVVLESHYDRDYDPIADRYRLIFWVKGRGVGTSNEYRTGSYHPATRFYTIPLRMSAKVSVADDGDILVEVEVGNYASYWVPRTHPIPHIEPWSETRTFKIKW